MSSSNPSSDGEQPARSRPDDVSVNRRGFFRQILGLGLDQIDQAGKRIGQRMGDFVESERTQRPAELPKLQRPDNTQARE